MTDGSTSGDTVVVSLVKDINPTVGSTPSNFTHVSGTLYFTADDGTKGEELWKSDGTAGGTTLVKDINPDGASSSPDNLIRAGFSSILYFTADDGVNGRDTAKSSSALMAPCQPS